MAEIKLFGRTISTDIITDTHKIIASSVLSAVILGVGLYYLSYPIYTEYQTLKEENQKLEDENTQVETSLGYSPLTKRYRKIEVVQKEIEDYTNEIAKLQSRIPIEENIPTLIYDLELMTESNKTDLLSIAPSSLEVVSLPDSLKSGTPTGLESSLQQVPIKISLETTYPNLVNLFKDFERYERTLATDTVTLAPAGSATKFKDLKVSFNLRAFVLIGGGN